MSQFKKSLLKNMKRKMNLVLKDSNRFVQSQKNQEVLFVMNLWWKKIHQILTFPSFLMGKIGFYPLKPKI